MDPFVILFISFLAGIILGGFALNMVIYFIAPFLKPLEELWEICLDSVCIPNDTKSTAD